MIRWRICPVLSAFLLLLTCCGIHLPPEARYGTIDNPRTTYRPVSVPRNPVGVVDTDALFADVETEVRTMLPGAYLRGIVFAGQASDLATLDGGITFDFVQVRPRVLWKRIIVAAARVETEEQALRIRTRDETGHYPSTDRLSLDEGLPFRDIAAIAQEQLRDLGLEEHAIAVTRFGQNEWVVVCGEIGTFERECEFRIDALTGDIAITAP